MGNNAGNSDSGHDVSELRFINSLITKISGIKETNHILEIIIKELVKITDSDQGVISLISELERSDLSTVVRKGPKTGQGMPFKLNNILIGWVLQNRKILMIEDLDADPRFPGFDYKQGQFESIICCPMAVKAEIIGFTTLIRSSSKPAFTESESRLVGIIASQSAQIISNSLLMSELAKTVELLKITQQQLREENLLLKSQVENQYAIENIIGKSPAMKKVLTLVSKFAANDSPVLLTGETGTGKDLIARAIHYCSNRKDRSFVAVNCGFKTESLLESELFGHVKGAFTGAIKDKIGLFKEADGGTIFLDEIGDAPLATQNAILRVLQNGEIRQVGSTKTDIVDVRVISATNRNPKEEIAKGKFREDLFYRLNTFKIEMPSLRGRKSDIPLLINYFLDKLRVKLRHDRLSISNEAMEACLKYDWPGNVRELENEIERAAVICGIDGCINAGDLSPEIFQAQVDHSSYRTYRGNLREMVERIEKEIIESTLAEHNNNIMQTSKALGLTRKGLRNKISR
jgi:Nif-specific regulatory protein